MKIDKSEIRRTVLTELARQGLSRFVPVGISARHVHLTEADIEALFGKGYKLNPIRPLSQPGQFAAREQVTVIGPRGRLEHVRVLGPARKESQVEISISDSFVLGAKNCPVRLSGDLEGTMGVKLLGPEGQVELKKGLIVAARHLHMNEEQAKAFGIHDRQVIAVKVTGDRPCLLENVICRTGSGHELELHLDTDEANACALGSGDLVEIVPSGEAECAPCGGQRDRIPGQASVQGQAGGTGGQAGETWKPAGAQVLAPARLERNIAPSMREGNAPIPEVWREPTPAQKYEFRPVECTRQVVEVPEEEILELVTERDINDAYRDNKTQIYCEKKALITPSAKDRAVAAGIKIIRMKGRD